MQIREHRLEDCEQLRSPNYNDRPSDMDICLLVIHGISLPPGQYGGPYINQLFCNSLSADDHPYFEEICHLKVSSHLLIRRDGGLIQYVPFNKRAWHAGQSSYGARDNCNDFSIGIELEGEDDSTYELIQYQQLAKVSALLIAAYPGIRHCKSEDEISVANKASEHRHDHMNSRIQGAHIVGHYDIAPGRKTDPGSHFDWSYYRELLLNLDFDKGNGD
ncbi:MAG: 1,6-anhydro-N-acetylmuramyl-L-alanine amidase AmpD [Pseudomonadales bacterium]|nr:1,6-anhydro-N-acetylmuramyl-L-alanine amidase AmpD [Pseudomonadales bacterium]